MEKFNTKYGADAKARIDGGQGEPSSYPQMPRSAVQKDWDRLIGIGDVHAGADNNASALEYYERAKAIAERDEDRSLLAHVLKNIGEVHNSCGRPQQAVECFHRAIGLADAVGERTTRAFALLGKATSALLEHGTPEAVQRAEEALSLADELDNSELKWFCYSTLARIHEVTGDHRQRATYIEQSLRLH